MTSDDEYDWREQHLDWSSKQSRILNDNDNVLTYYSPENGYPYVPHELPHHHMEQGDTHVVFQNWAKKQCQLSLSSSEEQGPLFVLPNSVTVKMLPTSPIIGAWKRTIFAGRWEHTSHVDEVTYNIQTGTLFVDLRIPVTKPTKLWEKKLKLIFGNDNNSGINNNIQKQVLDSLTNDELRLYVRQHVFGGYTVLTTESSSSPHHPPNRVLATRHHCIDWNYIIGKPRVRPNKWYIECEESYTTTTATTGQQRPMNRWKELSYATDKNGQCYYYEIWKRIQNDEKGNDGLCLAMRQCNSAADGIFVVVGDHFNYVLGRQWNGLEKGYPNVTSLADLVDSALENNDRETVISYLSLDGGHGTISSGWQIDCAIQSWNHGRGVFDRLGGGGNNRNVSVVGSGTDYFQWSVYIGNTEWEIYESSITNAVELEMLLTTTSSRSML